MHPAMRILGLDLIGAIQQDRIPASDDWSS
jgi:hypothetical protein